MLSYFILGRISILWVAAAKALASTRAVSLLALTTMAIDFRSSSACNQSLLSSLRANMTLLPKSPYPAAILCEYFINIYTRPGEVAADICAGSGTTAVAALNTGRR